MFGTNNHFLPQRACATTNQVKHLAFMFNENVPDDVDIEVNDDAEVDAPADDTPADQAADPYADLTPDQLKDRLKKAERAIVKNKQKPPAPTITKPADGEIPAWGQKIIQSEEKRTYGFENGLSPEQVDAVYRYNGGQKPDEEMLKRPEVSAMIRALGAKDRVAANTPRGGNAPVYKGKTFAEVATDKAASKGDKQAAFEATKKRHRVN